MDSNKFNSGFNTIADQFRNKGVASNKQRMAGEYLSEFTKDSGVQRVLGNKDYRNGVSNSTDRTEPKPSAIMNTLGAKRTSAPAANTTSAASNTPATTASTSGFPNAEARTQMYYDSLTPEQQSKFYNKHRSRDKSGQEVGSAASHYDNMLSYYQNDEQEFNWADNYTGPKTFEEAGKIKATDGAESIASYLNQITRYNNAMNKKKKAEKSYSSQ